MKCRLRDARDCVIRTKFGHDLLRIDEEHRKCGDDMALDLLGCDPQPLARIALPTLAFAGNQVVRDVIAIPLAVLDGMGWGYAAALPLTLKTISLLGDAPDGECADFAEQ